MLRTATKPFEQKETSPVGDRIELPLELRDFDVIATRLVDGVLEIEVRSTFPRACGHCGSVAVIGHGTHTRKICDQPRGYPTVLVWHQRRWRCRDCARTSREAHPEVAGRR